MTRRRLLLFSITATLTLRPSVARAQLEMFVQAVRELAVASETAEPSRSAGIRAAANRMEPALAEWDRRIDGLRSRNDRELDRNPTADHAYQLHVEMGVTYRAR